MDGPATKPPVQLQRLTTSFTPPADTALEASRFGFELVEVDHKGTQHPRLATERLVGNALALRAAVEDWSEGEGRRHERPVHLWDVGANPRRTQSIKEDLHLNFTLHNLIPQLHRGDAHRIRGLDAGKYTWCTHRMQVCTCLAPDALLFIHSSYYIPPLDLAIAISRTTTQTAYIVAHEFHGAAGTMSGEGQWHLDLTGNVIFTARGNPVYVHPPQAWLSLRGWSDGLRALHARAIVSIGSTTVFSVVYNNTPITSITPLTTWPSALAAGAAGHLSEPLVTALNSKFPTPNYDTVRVPITAVEVWGGCLHIYQQGTVQVPVPVGLIDLLIARATGLKRDHVLFSTLLALAKRHMQGLKIPDSVVAACVFHAVLLAFVATVESETGMLTVAAASQSALWRAHAAAVDFRPYTHPGFFWRGILALLGQRTAARRLVNWWYGSEAHRTNQVESWFRVRQHVRVAAALADPVVRGPVPALPGEFEPKPDAPLHASAKISAREPHPRLLRDPANRLVQIGPIFATVTPSYIPATVETAANSLTQRLLMARDHAPDRVRWQALHLWLDQGDHTLTLLCAPTLLVDEDLVAAWRARFPPAVAKRLVEAAESLASRPLTPRDCHLDAITKQEKGGLVFQGEPAKPAHARAVFSMTPRFNAATGPHYWAYSRAVRQALNDLDGDVLWSAGLSSEEVGGWFDRVVVRHGGWGAAVFHVGDQSRFEAHQSIESDYFQMATMVRSGVSSSLLEAHRMSGRPRGMHRNAGLWFALDDVRRTSGRGDTSVGNVVVSIAYARYAYGPPGPQTWAGLFNGDDSIIVLTPEFALSVGPARVKAAAHELGLSIEVLETSARADIEFCQLLPYPSEDGTVFAPKIGRILPRIGWTCSAADDDIYAVAMGLRDSVAHVPFLTDFVGMILRTAARGRQARRARDLTAVRPHNACAATWDFLQERYGLTAVDHESFLSLLAAVDAPKPVLTWGRMEDVARRDA